MRKIIISGLVALATVLGTWVAVTAASASSSQPRTVSISGASSGASAPSTNAGVASSPVLSRLATGSGAGAATRLATHSLTYPAGVTPAAVAPLDVVQDVNCSSPTDCLAVGENATANGGHGSPRAFHWTGSAWTATPVSLPASTSGGFLNSVSCTAGSCVAVGVYFRGSTPFLLSEIWNGSSWRIALPPAISGSRFPVLSVVSCVSPTHCVAAGSYVPASNLNDSVAIVGIWNGSTWQMIKAPAVGTMGFAAFFTISCTTTTFCMLGGEYASSVRDPQGGGFFTTLVERFNGTSFSRGTDATLTPQAGFASYINSISCTGTAPCVAVAEQTKTTGAVSWHAWAETFNGSRWARAVVSLPTNTQTFLDAVSCATSTYCVAVGGAGSFTHSTSGKAIFAVMNGSSWALHFANPPSGQGNFLVGGECLSTTFCVASGAEGPVNTDTGHGLSWFWNGGKFTLVNLP